MTPEELKKLIQEHGIVFEEHKNNVDAQLEHVKTIGTESAEIKEKQERISDDMDRLEDLVMEIQKRMNRQNLPGDNQDDPEFKFYDEALRCKGDYSRYGQKAAMNTGSPSTGGIFVPQNVEKKLLTMLQDDVAMRRMARVIKSKGIFTKNIKTDGQTAQWTGEEGPISKGDGLKFAQLRPGYGYVSTWTDVSETMLDDADFNVSDMILEDSREVFAPSEEEKFLNGTGVESPKGLFNKTPVSTVDASRAFGTLQYIATGKADGFLAPTSSVSPADVLIELTETPKTGYLGRAQWLMSRSTRRVVRCFKDADGRFIYQTSMVAGVPSSLLGYGVEISDSMPSIAANTFPLAFGDFYRGYLIHDRLGMKVKIDPFAGPEYVDYYVRRIVGGTVMDSNAIKLLKVATS